METSIEQYQLELTKLVENYTKGLRRLYQQLNQKINRINKRNISRNLKIILLIRVRTNYNNNIKKLTSDYNNKKNKLTNIINSLLIHNKKALLVGINYINTPNELYGCINDTTNIKKLLENNFKYTMFNILTDTTNIKPTKQNILDALTNLLVNSVSGDTLFFLYSGHGTCTIDMTGDELDGQDEMIVPLDGTTFKKCILDDELNQLIRTNLKSGTKLFMMFDSCFSGTVVDLKYNYIYDSELQVTNNNVSEINGEVYMISGCKDNQTSVDAYVRYNNTNMSSGAMTYSFLKTINELGMDISFKTLIENMRNILNTDGYEQIPQLSSSLLVDINTTKISL